MKHFIILLLLSTATANAQSNEIMKMCLKDTGYTPKTFYQYDFSKGFACWSNWKSGYEKLKMEKQRQFLEENPWYKGNNWKWEERAEYDCEKIYSTQMMANITICHKPYYLN
jgi:hypothetical protein